MVLVQEFVCMILFTSQHYAQVMIAPAGPKPLSPQGIIAIHGLPHNGTPFLSKQTALAPVRIPTGDEGITKSGQLFR